MDGKRFELQFSDTVTAAPGIAYTHDESGARTPHAVIEITANQVLVRANATDRAVWTYRVAVAALTSAEARAFAAEIISLADAADGALKPAPVEHAGALHDPSHTGDVPPALGEP
jgi:hypothetical protein